MTTSDLQGDTEPALLEVTSLKLSNRSLFAALALAALPLACSSARVRPNAAGGAAGPVRIFTDSDFINDVASAEGFVYVATERGLLKYPATGGAPTRLTTRDGLPSDRLLAVAVSDDGSALWVATAQGIVRAGTTGAFAPVGHPQAQPDVGKPTALITTADGVIVGGEHGLARWNGIAWSKLSDRYQVTELSRSADDHVLVATAQTGLLVLSADLASLDEHNVPSGIPEQMIRSVVSLPGGKLWALVQGPTGMQLAHFDGNRWFGYTTGENARATWLAVVPSAAGVALVTQAGLFEIVLDRGEDLLPTGAAAPGGLGHIELHPTVYEPPPPPPPPAPAAPPRRGRRPAAAVRPAAPAAPAAPAHPVVATPALPATPATAHGDAAVMGDASVTDAATATVDGGVADGATEATADAGAPVVLAPIRIRDVPALGFPLERQSGGSTIDAPTYGLIAVADRVPGDVVRADVAGRDTFVSRVGLGVTRLPMRPNQSPVEYRVHDLAMQRRALSLATDGRGNVWMVSEDGGPVRYSGRTFERVALEEDPQVHPLMFWSQGANAYAVARVGDANILRGYKLEGATWRRLIDGPVETYGPGTVDVRFLTADHAGKLWVGLRVLPPAGATGDARELGVAVLDPNAPVTPQYNANIPATGGENGSRRTPSDLSAVAFDAADTAWFAGIEGLTSIRGAGEVARFREAEGVRGDLVGDVTRALGDRIYFATPEGLGLRANNEFAFPVEGSSAQPRVTALAVDTNGMLWGAGPRGVWRYDGHAFTRIGRAEGLPTEDFNDIAIDAQNRVWLSTTDGLVLYDQAIHAQP